MSLSVRIQHRLSERFELNINLNSDRPMVGLTGPSGSGKTSILNIIAGIQAADEADIRVNGEPISDLPPALRRVGLAMQSPHLFPHLNVRENLVFGAEAAEGNALKECIEWLEIDSLIDRPVRHLSGGERQRVALGRAVLSNPRILLLDEPFAAVDGERTTRIASALRDHAGQAGIGVLMVSHNTSLLDTTVDEVITVMDGRNLP